MSRAVEGAGPEIELEYDPSLSEHLAAERLYYRTTRGPGIDKSVAALLLLACAALTVDDGIGWWTPVLFLLALAEWFGLVDLHRLRVRVQFNRNPKFRERHHLTFTEAGLHFTTGSIASRIEWSFFTRLLEDERLVLLVYGKWQYSVLPKHAFKSDADLASLRRMFERHSSGQAD